MMRHWFLAAALAFATPATAQQAILQGGPWVPGHAPQYLQQGGTQPVVKDAGGSGGGPLGVNLSEAGITARDPKNHYPSIASGNGPHGEHFCIYDAPTNNPTGYHYICMEPSATQGGIISTGGSQTNNNFGFLINNVYYPFPGTSGSPLTVTDGTTSIANTTHLQFSGATVSGTTPNALVTITGGGGTQTYSDGTHTVTGATNLTVTGGTIGGSTPNATLLIPGGSSGITFTDGVHTVAAATQLTAVSGAVIGGTTPNATITVPNPGWTLTDGTHTVSGATQMTVTGALVGGSTPNGTLAINPSSLIVGSTTIASGSSGFYLTDNAGVLGNVPVPTPGITFTDGTHTVAGGTQLTVSGATIGGTTPNPTLSVNAQGLVVGTTTVTGGSSGNALTINSGVLGSAAIPTLTYATNADVWTHADTTKIINSAIAATSTAPQTFTESAGTFSINFNSGINLELPLVHADCPCTIANPTNVYAGLSGNMTLLQSATGSDTIGTWGTTWKFSGGVKPTLTATANAIDVLPFYCRTTTFCVVTFIANAQ